MKVKSNESLKGFFYNPISDSIFKNKMYMGTMIITPRDLEIFKQELLEEIKTLFLEHQTEHKTQWVKASAIMKMFAISTSSLQNYRINGILSYSKIGGVIYYDLNELMETLEKNRIKHPS